MAAKVEPQEKNLELINSKLTKLGFNPAKLQPFGSVSLPKSVKFEHLILRVSEITDKNGTKTIVYPIVASANHKEQISLSRLTLRGCKVAPNKTKDAETGKISYEDETLFGTGRNGLYLKAVDSANEFLEGAQSSAINLLLGRTFSTEALDLFVSNYSSDFVDTFTKVDIRKKNTYTLTETSKVTTFVPLVTQGEATAKNKQNLFILQEIKGKDIELQELPKDYYE